jgi:hypothetical protein
MEIGHPAVQSGILPLTCAFLMTAVLRLAGWSGWGVRIASGAIGIALLVSSILILGLPAWPAQSGMQKFFYLTAGGLLLGVLLDLREASSRLLVASGLVWMTAVFFWLAWPQLDSHHSLWLLAGIYLAGVMIMLRVTNRPIHDTSAPIMFLMTASSLGGIAFVAGSLSIAELGFALAAAFGGFMLWNWPQPRYRFGAAGLLGGGMSVLALAFLVLLLTDVSPWALTSLVLIFFADSLSRRLPAGAGLLQKSLQPVYLVLLGTVPGALAVVFAWLTEQPDSLYYQ